MNLVRMNRQNLISLHGVLHMLDAEERFEVGHASGTRREFGEYLLKKTVCGDESGGCFGPGHLLAGEDQYVADLAWVGERGNQGEALAGTLISFGKCERG